jgi:acyl-CoA thioesterase-1
MKMTKILYSALFLLMYTVYCNGQDYHVRMAFIGNSITYGVGLSNPSLQSYPAQLNDMLTGKYGDTCIIGNFAITTKTMLKNGDEPFWNIPQFVNSWNFAPEICFIALGTNDTKPQNWDVYGDQFLEDYMSMIDTFKVRNPNTKFMICYPPPAFDIVWGIRDSIIVNGVIPVIDSLVNKTGAILVDFHNPLLDSVALFPDKIHPNVQGSKVLAEIVFSKMLETDIIHHVETGLTFVNSLKSGNKLIAIEDSVTLSWTTINADSAFLDGKPVAVNGSLYVSPHETTVYTLLAKGIKSIDSLKFTQEVYIPALTRLSVTPWRIKVQEGDSVHFTLEYFDQMNKRMKDTVFVGNWTIEAGVGQLVDETNTTCTFIAGTAGTAKIVANVGDLTFQTTVTIEPLTTITDQSTDKDGRKVYPNPVEDILNLIIETQKASRIHVRLYDLNGTIQRNEHFFVSNAGKHTIHLMTNDLIDGLYLYEIEYCGSVFTGKINKQTK